MKVFRTLDRIRRKFTVIVFGIPGMALVWLALPGTAAGLEQGALEVNIKTKFAEIILPAGENRPWNELVGDEVNKAFAAYPQTGQMTNSAGGAASAGGGVIVSNSPSSTWPIQNATVVGVLSDAQYRSVLMALDQRDGVDVLTAPEVTTESGRQAQVQAVDYQMITNGAAMVPHSDTWATNAYKLVLGPTIGVLPTVSADGFSLNLKLMPSLTKYVAYANARAGILPDVPVGDFDAPARPGPPGMAEPATMTPGTAARNPGVGVVPQNANPGQPTLATNVLLPHFWLRQANFDIDVWDTQTIVIGFSAVEFPAKEKDKPPVKKALLVFVTATVINPDGTRAHSDEEIPKSGMPPQTGANSVPKK